MGGSHRGTERGRTLAVRGHQVGDSRPPPHLRPLRTPTGQHGAIHNGREVVDAYGEREREFADRPHIEVVLLGADSEEAIRVTHAIYFETDFSLEKYFEPPWLTPHQTVDEHVPEDRSGRRSTVG